MENYTDQSGQYSGPQQPLPNATAVLILGILSILGNCCYGIPGLILGIIAIVLGIKDERLYKANPGRYTAASYGNAKAGKICGIIGIVLSCLFVIAIIIVIAVFGLAALSNPHAFQDALNNAQ
jgi:hypothetical protein